MISDASPIAWAPVAQAETVAKTHGVETAAIRCDVMSHASVAEVLDLANVRLVVDVGGGNGGLLAALFAAMERLTAAAFGQRLQYLSAVGVLGLEK